MNSSTDFAPEPYLPWLRTDPAMQQPDAFVSVEVLTLPAYLPMSRHYPAGTQVAAKRIFCAEDLTEGVYWLQRFIPAGKYSLPEQTICNFGRFAGISESSNPRAQARRLKQGVVHFELSADVACESLRRDYLFREDGTQTVHVDFADADSKLWRFTHYVALPDAALSTLGLDMEVTGYTLEQKRWLQEEQAIWQDLGAEFTAQVLGGFPLPELRAVLTYQQYNDFNCVLNTLPRLMPSQARKRRAGSVLAIGWRSTNYLGQPVTLTEYVKAEDAGLLLDQLQSLTDLHRAEARVRESRAAVQVAATAIRSAREATRAVQVPAQALSFASAAPLAAIAA